MFRLAFAVLLVSGFTGTADSQSSWTIHDLIRPQPSHVTPGKIPGAPSSDAIVLFSGKTLEEWRAADGTPAEWKIAEGYFEVTPDTGDLFTRRRFGDCQLHVEWASPPVISGDSQDRGNSGVFVMGLFEIQVLDTWHNDSYADGTTAAIYGQYPPLANAVLPPGEWQAYDIMFRRPHFEETGRLLKPARVTVLHNGGLVQDAVQPSGPTAFRDRPPYTAIADKLPLSLQNHGNPVRYRNVWIRELPDEHPAVPPTSFVALRVEPDIYRQYVGDYQTGDSKISILFDGHKLSIKLPARTLDLIGVSDDAFFAPEAPARIFFLRSKGKISGITILRFGQYHEWSRTQ